MEISRLSRWEQIVGGAGLLLAASPLLPWWSVERLTQSGAIEKTGISGWQGLSGIDVVVFAIGVAVAGMIAAKAAGRSPRLPVAPAFVIGVLGAVAVILSLYRAGSPPDVSIAAPSEGIDLQDVGGVGLPQIQISTDVAHSAPQPGLIYAATLLGGLIIFGSWKILGELQTSVGEQIRQLRDRVAGGATSSAVDVPGATAPARPSPATQPPTGTPPPPPPPDLSVPSPPPPPPPPQADVSVQSPSPRPPADRSPTPPPPADRSLPRPEPAGDGVASQQAKGEPARPRPAFAAPLPDQRLGADSTVAASNAPTEPTPPPPPPPPAPASASRSTAGTDPQAQKPAWPPPAPADRLAQGDS